MTSSNHGGAAVHPTYSTAGQYPGAYGMSSVAIDQPQHQHNSSSNRKNFNASYSRVSSILFGFLQIVLCLVSIAGAVMVAVEEGSGDDLGTGFWCGAIYAIAGCLAAAAGWHAPKSMIIAVAVFSFLDIPFGIAAIVLAVNGLIDDGNCNGNYCFFRNPFAIAGNAMITVTGFWAMVFGLCLLIISVRAICIGSKPQVSSVPVYYTSSAPETVQFNPSTSLHGQIAHSSTINGAIETSQRSNGENQYEIEQNRF